MRFVQGRGFIGRPLEVRFATDLHSHLCLEIKRLDRENKGLGRNYIIYRKRNKLLNIKTFENFEPWEHVEKSYQ